MSFKILSIFFICLQFILARQLYAQNFNQKPLTPFSNSKNETISLFGSIYADSIDSEQNESRLSGVEVRVMLFQSLTPDLVSLIDVSAYIETGSNKSLFLSEYAPTQSLELNQGFLEWTPIDYFNFKIGAISQGYLDYPLLFGDSAFMSLNEKFIFNLYGDYYLYFQAAQSIPNNSLISNRTGTVDSGTPKVFTHTAGLDLNGDITALSFMFTHFSFKQLTSGIAHQSRFMGNQVSGIGQDNASFDYGFEGFNVNTKMEFKLNNETSFSLKYGHLFNNKAPDSRNESHLFNSSLKYFDYLVSSSYFINKSDTVPALFNDKKYGHNNRQGFALKLKKKYPIDKFLIELDYVNSKIIDEDIRQSNLQVIQLSLTKQYDL